MTTEGSGNTKPSLEFRGRNFQLTLNEIDKYEDLMSEFKKLKSCTYIVSAKEKAPTTGHEHIHIYAHFNNPYKLNKKIIAYGAHIEICKGTPKQNIDYIKKDGEVLDEIGEEPHQGVQYTVQDLKDTKDPSQLDWHAYNTWSRIQATPQKIKKAEWSKNVEVYYIWGDSGTGKSTMAEKLADDEIEEVKYTNDFWNGVVDGNGCCIYDDFRDSHMKASEFINFIDYRTHNLNIKGGNIRNNYTKIIITSIQSPEEIYRNLYGEPRLQWMRRLKVIHLEKKDEECI